MALFPNWNEWFERRKSGHVVKVESKGRQPDYSFDRWVQMSQDIGDDVNRMVHGAEEEEKRLDKLNKDKKSKSPKTLNKVTKEPEKSDKEDPKEKDVWDRLKRIHQDYVKNGPTKDKEDQDGEK